MIDPRARRVVLDGRDVDLTRKEFDLLFALASRKGEVVSKRTLLAEVWQQAYGGGDRTVDVHLSWLRRKLGETAAEPRYLHTVRGVGIRFAEPGRGLMRRRIGLLVAATTSAVVLAFVVPLCLLVRNMAEDRAMADADQEARNIAILVSSLHGDPTLSGRGRSGRSALIGHHHGGARRPVRRSGSGDGRRR